MCQNADNSLQVAGRYSGQINTYTRLHPIIFAPRARGKEVRPVCSCPLKQRSLRKPCQVLSQFLNKRNVKWKRRTFLSDPLLRRHVEVSYFCFRVILSTYIITFVQDSYIHCRSISSRFSYGIYQAKNACDCFPKMVR